MMQITPLALPQQPLLHVKLGWLTQLHQRSPFSPANSATSIAKDSNITLTFSEAIRNNDNSEITNSNVGSLITLKATNSSGNNIGFAA